VSVLQFGKGRFDGAFLVGGQFVTQFFQLFFCLEDQAVCVVELVDAFLFLFVEFGIGSSLILHPLDFGIGQTAGSLDTDTLLFAGSFVLGRYIEDTIGVDIEGYFDLRGTTTSGGDTIQVETADGLVVLGHGAFTLKDVDLNGRLVVGSCGKDFRFLGRNGGVRFNQFGHHTAHGFDTQGKRGYV